MFPATDANLDRNASEKKLLLKQTQTHGISLFSSKANLLTAALAQLNCEKACFAEKTLSGAAKKGTVNLDNTCKCEIVLVISGKL